MDATWYLHFRATYSRSLAKKNSFSVQYMNSRSRGPRIAKNKEIASDNSTFLLDGKKPSMNDVRAGGRRSGDGEADSSEGRRRHLLTRALQPKGCSLIAEACATRANHASRILMPTPCEPRRHSEDALRREGLSAADYQRLCRLREFKLRFERRRREATPLDKLAEPRYVVQHPAHANVGPSSQGPSAMPPRSRITQRSSVKKHARQPRPVPTRRTLALKLIHARNRAALTGDKQTLNRLLTPEGIASFQRQLRVAAYGRFQQQLNCYNPYASSASGRAAPPLEIATQTEPFEPLESFETEQDEWSRTMLKFDEQEDASSLMSFPTSLGQHLPHSFLALLQSRPLYAPSRPPLPLSSCY
eukprot:3988746-Pleurochrysis_carterae.AAC.1